MKQYIIKEKACPNEYAYRVKALNLSEVRYWISNHLDTSLEYIISEL